MNVYNVLDGLVLAMFLLALAGGKPFLEHRRKMKQLDIEKIREERLLLEAQHKQL